jgi:hypothetical protein
MKLIILNDSGKNQVVRRVKQINSKQTKLQVIHAKGVLEVSKKDTKTIIIQLNSFYN